MLEALKNFSKYADIALACSIVGVLMVLLFPISTVLLDLLLAFSIAISFVILMTTLFIVRPLELSIFPTILLVTTLLRLSLNIASTRLILSNGHNGTDAAGHVIQAFGSYVMQGNVVIGLIVFLILTLINFIVITKGSGRIAEVAARFSLDAMPGKQMAIDSDLNAGLIDENTARTRRKTLEDESTFYGAMDGANKFVRGDAIAGVIITFINLIGGMIVGILQKNLSFDIAVQTYAVLTIGDGLIAQIPSLIISLSAGLLVTKAGSTSSANQMIFDQLGRYPQALIMTSIVTGLMAFLPGLPFIPFALISFATMIIAYFIFRNSERSEEPQIEGKQQKKPHTVEKKNLQEKQGVQEANINDEIAAILHLDIIRLEIGEGVKSLITDKKAFDLAGQLQDLRKQIAQKYGFVLPSVKIMDNKQLDVDTYIIKIKEFEVGQGFIRPGKLMIINMHGNNIDIPGENTKDPAFNMNAKWVDENYKEEALSNNYTAVDPCIVIITHITELIKANITDLLSYGETQKLIDNLAEEYKQLVKDVIPNIVSIAFLQKVLQNLLSESIPIRDLPTILESMIDSVKTNKNLTATTESVRVQLSKQICYLNTNKEGFILIIDLSPEWEKAFIESLTDDGSGHKQLSMQPSKLQEFVTKFQKIFDEQAIKGYNPVLLTGAYTRPYIRAVIERFRPSTFVMSQSEIHVQVKIKRLGSI